MELHGYGVTLRQLTEDKLELVRRWRNDPKIQQYMSYREHITPEMQRAWFQRINNEHNFYFIIVYQDREIGLINIRDVDYENKCGEPGIFVWDDEYLDSDVPMRASLCLGSLIWDQLELDYLTIHVLRSNKRAIDYNLLLGFKRLPNQDHLELQEYRLTRQEAKNPAKKLLTIIKILQKSAPSLT